MAPSNKKTETKAVWTTCRLLKRERPSIKLSLFGEPLKTPNWIGSAAVCVSPVVDWQPAQDVPLMANVCWDDFQKQMGGWILRASCLTACPTHKMNFHIFYTLGKSERVGLT